jgi:hypothetical protein
MADETRRISIGLIGMQVLELRLTDDAYHGLRQALESDNPGWHSVPTQDAEVLVDLSKVTYISLASQAQRVGF